MKKLTKEIAEAIMKQIKTDEFQNLIKNQKEAEQTNGTFEVIISTDFKDRSGEIIDQNGWKLEHFKNNPVVLWAHDYGQLPIGMAKEVFLNDKGQLQAKGVFASHAFAQEVRKLYDQKIIRATSVGFIPKESQGNTITSQELIEFSFVPVPCNPEALDIAKSAKLNIDEMKTKGFFLEKEIKRVVAQHETPMAPIDQEWDGTSAVTRMREHFSIDGSGEKDQIEWEKYLTGFSWINEVEVNDFNSYKLPHHDIVDGEFMSVFKGIVATMEALNGARGGVDVPEDDRQGIWEHLAKHYEQFGEEAPELKTMEQIEEDKNKEDNEGELEENNIKEVQEIATKLFNSLRDIGKVKKETVKRIYEIIKEDKEIKDEVKAKLKELILADENLKGIIEEEMTRDSEEMDKKWRNLDAMENILWAFYDIYLLNSTPADKFKELMTETIGLLQRMLNDEEVEEKKIEAKTDYVNALKMVREKAITTEEIGAIMTQLQADLDNLIIVASRELQSIADSKNPEEKELNIKKLITLLNKEIGVVSERPEDIESTKTSDKKDGDKIKVGKKEGTDIENLNSYLDLRAVLRNVDNVVNISLEKLNKKIKENKKTYK